MARGTSVARLAAPLAVVTVDGKETEVIKQLIVQEDANRLVVGLPRNLNQEETEQTRKVKDYVKNKLTPLGLPVVWQDEAGSTVEAGKSRGHKSKFSTDDAHAAAIILQDYLDNL